MTQVTCLQKGETDLVIGIQLQAQAPLLRSGPNYAMLLPD